MCKDLPGSPSPAIGSAHKEGFRHTGRDRIKVGMDARDALIVGAEPGASKLEKAQALGVPMLDDAAFQRLIMGE